MRKLKFRFWIEKEKKMCSWELMKKECNRLSILEMEGFVPLQFTGLLDKNGKEIYEGDIVKAREQNNISKKKHKQEIIFYYGCFMLAMLPRKIRLQNILAPFIKNDCEVIGNIYQNKELLI